MEIIVVDGVSTDGTLDWLMRQTDIITVIQHNRGAAPDHKRKRSWGYFINIGFRIAQAPWVLMLSDDCLLLPNAISQAESHARQMQNEGRKIGGVAFYFRDWPNEEEPRYFVQHTIGGMLMVNHGFFNKAALEEVGYAEEEEFSFYKADSDLCLKIWHAGYEITDCKTSFVEHLLLPSELLRTANTQSMNDDRLSLFNRWDGIYEKIDFPDMFKKAYREYSDYTSGPAKCSDHYTRLTPNVKSILGFIHFISGSVRQHAHKVLLSFAGYRFARAHLQNLIYSPVRTKPHVERLQRMNPRV